MYVDWMVLGDIVWRNWIDQMKLLVLSTSVAYVT